MLRAEQRKLRRRLLGCTPKKNADKSVRATRPVWLVALLRLSCRLCSWCLTEPAASAHAGAEFLALFRRHLLPALPHAMPPAAAAATAPAKSAKQNLGQHDQSQRLPE